jgi:hypothetical protein
MPSLAKEWSSREGTAIALFRSLLDNNRTVVLDLSFAIDAYWPVADKFAAHLLDSARPYLKPDHRIVVLLDRGTHPTDDVRQSTLLDPLASQVLIGDTTTGEFEARGSNWPPTADIAEVLKAHIVDVRDALAARVVRRRGIFEDPLGAEPGQYRFSAENAADHLQQLLEHYVAAQGIQTLVYDDESEPWFAGLVKAVALAATEDPNGLPVYTSSRLVAANKSGRSNSVTKRLIQNIKDRRVAAILPMIKSGDRAATMRSAILGLGGEPQVVAAMARETAPGTPHDGFFRDSRAIGSDVAQVDYFAGVRHHPPLASHQWLIEAAELLEEVEKPMDDWAMPTRVAMWSLFDKIGTEVEFPMPRPRPRIEHFPKLRKIEDVDALWLAECLVRTAERKVGTRFVPRTQLFFVIPEESSGSKQIAAILKDVLEVAVVQISRTLIEDKTAPIPTEFRATVLGNISRSIVLLDESAVTFVTLNRMAEIIRDITGKPRLSLAVVESGNRLWASNRPPELVSFYRLGSNAHLVPEDAA